LKQLSGVIVPILTPFNADGSFDAAHMNDLLDRLIEAGVDALFVAGTTGEVFALASDLRVAAIEHVCAHVAGRVPVVTGIGATCLEDILHFAEVTADAGGNYMALQPPPYFPMSEEEVYKFYKTVLDVVEVPVLLYNIPSFTSNNLTAEIVARLVGHEKVVGLKDSTGDLKYFEQVMRTCHRDGFGVYMGEESYIAEAYRSGAEGIVPSLGNLYPELFVRITQAAARRDWATVDQLQLEINAINARLKGGSWVERIRWMKAQLEAEGVCQGYVATLFTNPAGETQATSIVN
jgi:4-hydroxy-tetrahydrodipicolinate synthase